MRMGPDRPQVQVIMLLPGSRWKKGSAAALLCLLGLQFSGSVVAALRLDRYLYILIFERGIAETAETEGTCPSCSHLTTKDEGLSFPVADGEPAVKAKVQRKCRLGCTCPHCRPCCPMGERCRCMERRARRALGGTFFQAPGCHPGDPFDALNSVGDLAGIYLLPDGVELNRTEGRLAFRPLDQGPIEPDPEEPPSPPPQPISIS